MNDYMNDMLRASQFVSGRAVPGTQFCLTSKPKLSIRGNPNVFSPKPKLFREQKKELRIITRDKGMKPIPGHPRCSASPAARGPPQNLPCWTLSPGSPEAHPAGKRLAQPGMNFGSRRKRRTANKQKRRKTACSANL